MFSKLVAFAGLLTLALSAPVDELERKRQTHRVVGKRMKDAEPSIETIIRNYELHNRYLNQTSGNANVEKRAGRAVGYPFDSDAVAYYWPIKVGKDKLNVAFTTYLTDFWTYSTRLPAAQQQGHSVYHFGGQKKQNASFDINLGGGQTRIYGEVWTDKVTVGGITATQDVETASYISDYIRSETADVDGWLGWGWESWSHCFKASAIGFCKPWWSTTRGMLDLPGFAIAYKPTQAIWDQGFLDDALYTGDMFYTQGYNQMAQWFFLTDGLSVGAQPGKVYNNRRLSTFVHSDLYFIEAPAQAVADYYRSVKGAKLNPDVGGGLYTFPCASKLPSWSVFLTAQNQASQAKRTVAAKHMNLGEYDAARHLCIGALQPVVSDVFDLALGVPFLKSTYVHHYFSVDDPYSPYVGVAQQR